MRYFRALYLFKEWPLRIRLARPITEASNLTIVARKLRNLRKAEIWILQRISLSQKIQIPIRNKK